MIDLTIPMVADRLAELDRAAREEEVNERAITDWQRYYVNATEAGESLGGYPATYPRLSTALRCLRDDADAADRFSIERMAVKPDGVTMVLDLVADDLGYLSMLDAASVTATVPVGSAGDYSPFCPKCGSRLTPAPALLIGFQGIFGCTSVGGCGWSGPVQVIEATGPSPRWEDVITAGEADRITHELTNVLGRIHPSLTTNRALWWDQAQAQLTEFAGFVGQIAYEAGRSGR